MSNYSVVVTLRPTRAGFDSYKGTFEINGDLWELQGSFRYQEVVDHVNDTLYDKEVISGIYKQGYPR